MKIDRRSFLALGLGTGVGITLTPLPWKAIDDLSIWSQNWSWIPKVDKGETTFVNSICTLCPAGCGITVKKIDERAIKIEGMKGHPVNNGGICLLGLSGLQMLYDSSRFKEPLKRKGKRGEGLFTPISWDQAISEVVSKLKEIRDKSEPHTTAVISGNKHGITATLLKRFMKAYGSPNFLSIPTSEDAYETALMLMHGEDLLCGLDLENSDFILSFGCGVIDGWKSPVRMFKANSLWVKNKVHRIQIEPRLSNTAAKFNEWIPILPGTETFLALSLCHIIIKESLYNTDFINSKTSSLMDWGKIVSEEFSPEKVSKVTGIDPNVIIDIAQRFAKAKNPIAICGQGQGNTPSSLYQFIAAHALNALTGSINKKGGVYGLPTPDYCKWQDVELDEIAAKGKEKIRIDKTEKDKFPHNKSLLNRIPQIIDAKANYPINALFISDANPLYTMIDNETFRKAMDQIPYIVSFSSFPDETSLYSDLILPDHMYLEKYEDIATPVTMPIPMIGLQKPVIKPQSNTKHIIDTILSIAKQLGGKIGDAFPWENHEDLFKKTFGEKWEKLNKETFLVENNWTPSTEFTTNSKKFEFFNSKIQSLQPVKTEQIEGDRNNFPLILIPYEIMRLATNRFSSTPFMIKTVDDTILKGKDIFVEINPETAKRFGLFEGSLAFLSTSKGQIKVRCHLFSGIRDGIIAIPRGLGHQIFDQFLSGKGININSLLNSSEDPVSGFESSFGIRAKLSIA